MRILIDALSARNGGGITYINNLMSYLGSNDTGHQFVMLLSPVYQQKLIDAVPESLEVCRLDLAATPLIRRVWYQHTGMVALQRTQHIDLLYAPAEAAYLRSAVPVIMLARNLSVYGGKSVSGEFQLSYILHSLLRKQPVFMTMRRARHVIFVSNVFRDFVLAQLPLPLEKTSVIHHGINPAFLKRIDPALRPVMERPYLLSVSTVFPHKNFETMIRAYAELSPDAPDLVIIGEIVDQKYYQSLMALVQEKGLIGRVHFPGQIPYKDLPGYYQGAEAFISSSRLETFGHPLLEAMSSAIPVLASNLPVYREICADAALYFEPLDSSGLAAAIRQALTPVTRQALVDAGLVRTRQFSWENVGRQLIDVFEKHADAGSYSPSSSDQSSR